MHMIKVSNIMGIDPKPFDPKTYVEEDVYVTDESGSKKRIRLENNIVRWRRVKNPDGTTSVSESFGVSFVHLRCMHVHDHVTLLNFHISVHHDSCLPLYCFCLDDM